MKSLIGIVLAAWLVAGCQTTHEQRMDAAGDLVDLAGKVAQLGVPAEIPPVVTEQAPDPAVKGEDREPVAKDADVDEGSNTMQPAVHPPIMSTEGATFIAWKRPWRWNPGAGKGPKLLVPTGFTDRIQAVYGWGHDGKLIPTTAWRERDNGGRPRFYFPRNIPAQMAIRVDALDGDYVLYLEDTAKQFK